MALPSMYLIYFHHLNLGYIHTVNIQERIHIYITIEIFITTDSVHFGSDLEQYYYPTLNSLDSTSVSLGPIP